MVRPLSPAGVVLTEHAGFLPCCQPPLLSSGSAPAQALLSASIGTLPKPSTLSQGIPTPLLPPSKESSCISRGWVRYHCCTPAWPLAWLVGPHLLTQIVGQHLKEAMSTRGRCRRPGSVEQLCHQWTLQHWTHHSCLKLWDFTCGVAKSRQLS